MYMYSVVVSLSIKPIAATQLFPTFWRFVSCERIRRYSVFPPGAPRSRLAHHVFHDADATTKSLQSQTKFLFSFFPFLFSIISRGLHDHCKQTRGPVQRLAESYPLFFYESKKEGSGFLSVPSFGEEKFFFTSSFFSITILAGLFASIGFGCGGDVTCHLYGGIIMFIPDFLNDTCQLVSQ